MSKSTNDKRTPAQVARSGVGALLIALLIAVRVWLAFSVAENSDESQHLHVAWSVAQGLLPYRDVFDNHAPMFQLVFAPIVAAIGERADMVPLMRLAMIPFYLCALGLTWYIGRALWSSRVGTIAAAITATAPIFFRNSNEFRPDVPWMVCWLAAVAVVVSPLRARSKAILAGLLIGMAFAVSLKTTLLVACACAAGAAIVIGARALRRVGAMLPIAIVATLAIPVAFAISLWWIGAADAAIYCLFGHNIVGRLGRWQNFDLINAALLVAGMVVLYAAHAIARRYRSEPSLGRLFVLSSSALYVLALYGVWPLVTHQDLLPAGPLLAIGVAASIVAPPFPLPKFATSLVAAAMAVVCFVNVAETLLDDRQSLAYAQARRQRVIELSSERDPIMDAKGFTIFRRRPVYWVLENVTEERIREGTIADTIATSLAKTSTPIVLADNLPNADRTFVERNYVCVDHGIFVAGQRLAPAEDGGVRTFDIAVPMRYTVIDESGVVPARIDGRIVADGMELAAGKHTLETDRRGPLVIIWAEFPRTSRDASSLAIRDPESC